MHARADLFTVAFLYSANLSLTGPRLHPLAYSFHCLSTHRLAPPLALDSPAYSITCALNHVFTYALTYLFTYSLGCPRTCASDDALSYLLTALRRCLLTSALSNVLANCFTLTPTHLPVLPTHSQKGHTSTRSLAYSRTDPLAHLLNHLLAQSFTYLHTRPLYSRTRLPTRARTHVMPRSLTHPFTHALTNSST